VEIVMSLPDCQQRILDAMAGRIQARDPRLAGMFAIFTRLNRQEPMPAAEHLDRSSLRRVAESARRICARTRRVPAVLIIPVALVALVCSVVLFPPSGGARSCGGELAGRVPVQLARRAAGCGAQLAPASYHIGH
jgi:hypothetical protein